MSNGDGTLTAQQALVRYDDDGDETYCNGIGDFDNDGELDLIIATGSGGGIVYHFGNMVNNEFVPKGQMNGPVDRFNVGYPANMALADFNEDNNLDFIVTYDSSQDCDLFMGNGNMEFTLKELPGTAPWSAIGADAGDFNGD